MVVSHHLRYRFDLSTQSERLKVYCILVLLLAFMCLDVTGGNSAMKVNADWQTVTK